MTDHGKFDKEAFASLLEMARGKRSINQYANEINISAAHISRLLRKLNESPPSPDTIGKFAKGAHNGVTYSEMMLAAGHIEDNAEEVSRESNKLKAKEMEKKFFQAIMTYLYTSNFEWNLNKTVNGLTDIMIEMEDEEYSKWYIEIKPSVSVRTLLNVYGQISLIEFEPDVKASIAVGSKTEFDLFVNKPPKSLRANLYVMLVDVEAGEVIKEEKLCQY